MEAVERLIGKTEKNTGVGRGSMNDIEKTKTCFRQEKTCFLEVNMVHRANIQQLMKPKYS